VILFFTNLGRVVSVSTKVNMVRIEGVVMLHSNFLPITVLRKSSLGDETVLKPNRNKHQHKAPHQAKLCDPSDDPDAYALTRHRKLNAKASGKTHPLLNFPVLRYRLLPPIGNFDAGTPSRGTHTFQCNILRGSRGKTSRVVGSEYLPMYTTTYPCGSSSRR